MMTECEVQNNALAKSERKPVDAGHRRYYFRLCYSNYATVSHDFDWLHGTAFSEVDKHKLQELSYGA